jgi:hypothetical protein
MMLDKFTERSRRVLVLAKEEAGTLNHSLIGSEHILLGLLREGMGTGSQALESLGITRDIALAKVVEMVGEGQPPPLEYIPFAPSTRRVLELSLDEADRLGRSHIGTESILLALTVERDGTAARVLVQLGAELGQVRSRVIELLAGIYPSSGTPAVHKPVTAAIGSGFLPSSEHVTAKLGQSHAIPADCAPSMAVPDIVDGEANQLLEDAVREAQEAGDLTLGGQHVLLAMCLGDNSGWLALRWAGIALRRLLAAALRATGNGSPHKQKVPLSRELRKALADGRYAAGQPLSAAGVLASLIRNQDPGCMQTIAGVGLLPQDVLDAITALARIGEIDAAAGRLATIARAAELTRSPRPGVPGPVRQTQDHRQEKPHSGVLVGARGWDAPDREAALSMFQFRLAAASGICLLLVISALIALVATAANGRLWLLALAPLLWLGNPRFGTWSIVPVAVAFWWLHLLVIATMVTASLPVDALMGALMLQRGYISESPIESQRDLRIEIRQVVKAAVSGAGTRK